MYEVTVISLGSGRGINKLWTDEPQEAEDERAEAIANGDYVRVVFIPNPDDFLVDEKGMLIRR